MLIKRKSNNLFIHFERHFSSYVYQGMLILKIGMSGTQNNLLENFFLRRKNRFVLGCKVEKSRIYFIFKQWSF